MNPKPVKRSSRGKPIGFIIVSLLIVTAWCWVAILSLQNYQAIELVNHDEPNYSDLIKNIDPLYSEALFFAGIGYAAEKEDNFDPEIERVFSNIAWYRPASPASWMQLAEWSAQHGLLDNARVYANTALLLLRNKPILAWELFDLFLYLKDPEQALQIAGNYLSYNPAKLFTVIEKIRQYEMDDEALLFALETAQIDKSLMQENIHQYLLLTISQQDMPASRLIWRFLIDQQYIANDELLNKYLQFLKKQGDVSMMKTVLADTGHAWQDNSITPLSAENVNTAVNLCWSINDSKKPFDWQWDTRNKVSKQASLQVNFTQQTNLSFYHISCDYIANNPTYDLTISGYWMGREISTTSGIYIEVLNADGRSIAKSEVKYGTWDWQSFELIIPTSPTENIQRLRIRRLPSKNLDNILSGSIWFDQLEMNTTNVE